MEIHSTFLRFYFLFESQLQQERRMKAVNEKERERDLPFPDSIPK